jgi:hypothetical protein
MPTLEQYGQAAELIYPGLGAWTYATFDRLNRQHFDGAVPLVPIRWHKTLPYGGSVGLASRHYIELGMYLNKEWCLHEGRPCLFGEHVLLHEMIHLYLYTRGENPKHNGVPWCREIMRIGHELGIGFHAEPSRVIKVKSDDGTRKSKRTQEGIPLKDIASFPHFAFKYHGARGTPLPAYLPQHVDIEQAG